MSSPSDTSAVDFFPTRRTIVVGPSGSGLSRLGERVYRTTEGAAMVSQDAISHITFLRDTVVEEIAFGLEQRGIPVPEMAERVDALVSQLGLAGVAERNPAELSGGQTKRVAIACVAVLGAATLVLDDPFAGLDTESRRLVAQLLRKYPGTVLVLAHEDPSELGSDFERFHLIGDSVGPGLPEARALALPGRVAPSGERIELGTLRGTRGEASRRWWQLRAKAPSRFVTAKVTLRPRRGAVLWLRGDNGAGKTTLLRTIVGFESEYRCPVSVSMQTQHASDQVLGSTVAELLPDVEARDRLGLDGDTHPLDLPQAKLRLAQVASVLGQRRELVLLDEPDVGLDHAHREAFHRLVAEALALGQAIIMTCHDPAVMEEVAAYAEVDEIALPSPSHSS